MLGAWCLVSYKLSTMHQAPSTAFLLHPRLSADTIPVADLPLCRLLLMNDSRFPWVILTPRRENIREIFELPAEDRAALMDEIAAVSQTLQSLTAADKMNVAALGNIVPQLHIHIIARFAGDCAWPNPVWGSGTAQPYGETPPLAAGLSAALTKITYL